jgi:outer membrane receptor for ferric coprogen and ferric-rhodotorulic acid
MSEEGWTYELGARTRWLDRRLTADAAVYYVDQTDRAINQVDNIDDLPRSERGAHHQAHRQQ